MLFAAVFAHYSHMDHSQPAEHVTSDEYALERAESDTAAALGAVARGDDPRAVEARRIRRARTDLERRLREAEQQLLGEYSSTDALFEAAHTLQARLTNILRARDLREGLQGPRAASVSADASVWLRDFRRQLGTARGRQGQQAAHRRDIRELLQPLADKLPAGLTPNGAAGRLADQLAEQGISEPAQRTIRQYLTDEIITYRK
jgi:hypothetical protein